MTARGIQEVNSVLPDPSLTSTWFVLDSGPGQAAQNMALDEALLESVTRLGAPVLRFYGWTEPAASFGYFQGYVEVSQLTPLRPLIRRCTGGGLVPHDADWTYSLCFPVGHWWYDLTAVESYRRVHEWICLAFRLLNVETIVAPHAARSSPGQCFAGNEQFDLLHHGRKIAGAAQRRAKWGLLIQGSVQSPVNCDRTAWREAMCAVGKRDWGAHWVAFEPEETIRRRCSDLIASRYSRDSYNRKR